MKVIIIGAGKVGKTLAKHLNDEGHNIVIIEKNKEILENLLNSYDIAGIVGNGATMQIQNEAEVSKADLFIAVTNNDELNLVCCKMASSLGAKKVVARVRDTDYTSQSEFMRESFGIDLIVNPELAAAGEIDNLLRFPFATQVTSFEKGKAVSVEIKVPEECPIVNKSVEEIVKEFSANLIVGAILREDKVIIPNGQDVICAGDYINLISTPQKIDAFFKKANIFNRKVKSVLIIGGSRIAYHLANTLTEEGIKVKIIERKPERCKQLLEILAKVEIVNADGSQKQILDEEGMVDFDALVSLTDIDEQNIIISLYAKSKNVETVISKVNNDTFYNLLEDINLEACVSPKDVIANQIIYFTRSLKCKEDGKLESLRKMFDSKLEIIEMDVADDSEIVGKPIKELELKKDVVIAAIVRKRNIVLPEGDVTLEGDDKIILATSRKIDEIDSILK